MESYSSREVIQIIIKDGWYLVGIHGSHHQFIHPTKSGKVTVPHPQKDFPIKTIKSILQQAGIKI